ncbi:hypothetical protein ES705_46149 [subsurface metagenome]
MIVAEAIISLSELREQKGVDLSVQECHAIGIALVIMIALEPKQVVMIDHLLSMTDAPVN